MKEFDDADYDGEIGGFGQSQPKKQKKLRIWDFDHLFKPTDDEIRGCIKSIVMDKKKLKKKKSAKDNQSEIVSEAVMRSRKMSMLSSDGDGT